MVFSSRPPASWSLHAKAVLALALLASQMAVQAAKNEPPAKPEPNANSNGPVVVTTDKVKEPKKHHEVKHGMVKPERHPSHPQRAVNVLR